MARSIRVGEFDVWRPGYAGKSVNIYIAGTTTLASVFSDPALTIAAANPQVLQSMTDAGGDSYGKWTAPIYVGVPYQLLIDANDRTGVQQLPVYDVSGFDLSTSIVTPTGGTVTRTIAAIAADEVHVEAFGTLGVTAAANTTILTNAIGVASARGGGDVVIPPGSYPFNQLTLPAKVRLRGHGRGVTTLTSQVADKVITLSGDRAGLVGLTLDGVSVLAGSIGVYAVGRTEPVFLDAEIKRFDTGIHLKGGDRARFRDAYVSNCGVGVDARGDLDAAGTGLGGDLRTLYWHGGKVDLCTTAGLRFNFIDKLVQGIHLQDVEFLSHTGAAVKVNGARALRLTDCRWNGCTTDVDVQDDSNTAQVANNTVRLMEFEGCRFQGGTVKFNGTAQRVRFRACSFENVSLNLTTPTNPIILLDCYEDSATTATGDTSKVLRQSRGFVGQISGVTTDATQITAWSLQLDPGEMVRIGMRVIGRQRDGVNAAAGRMEASASRAGATLTFDTASATLTAGAIVTGVTSGASARIVGVSGTTSGTLTLRDIVGAFVNGENLTFSTGQTAHCTGTLSSPSVTVHSTAAVGTDYKSDAAWTWTVDASASLVRLRVQGNTSQIVEWTVEPDVLRP